ncbi:replication-associated recombination protein A [Fervidobacterium thailandense]|uniref:Recombinase RarA n=1 Tax=Fervidobacterium thailandense TaxID=1008305 RepID=A0A1E3G1V5_9BACT|nr:replication-associated recombination protein A [Fervidobacterium thailandense]ODN30236.1 recombinase RarA [Fervidobacterium thailandense]
MSGLSEILRPDSFEDFVGQEHLFGAGALLRVAIEQDNLFSAILYGPPGCGKSSVARLIGKYTTYEVVHLNGAFLKVDEVKRWEEYAYNFRGIRKVVLFVDEIHRLNKKQQDVFLPGVETGTYVLIGTTTESPQHMINPALLSRCRVLRFKKLSPEDLTKILERAIRYVGVGVEENVLSFIVENANGDARFALSTYELLVNIAKVKNKQVVDSEILQLYAGEDYFKYTATEHYNLASAFIKSIRGSDPDAALYYMARMINGGEDPRFIARRLVILASEDIGLADPFALVLAVATMQAVEMVGMPECLLNLAECVIYLSLAPKSNSSYLAINRAMEAAKETMNVPVPKHLLNVEGSGYRYPHDYGGFVRQEYLPEELRNQRFYLPKNISKEGKIWEVYRKIWPDRFEK